jgi:hypothetical protein
MIHKRDNQPHLANAVDYYVSQWSVVGNKGSILAKRTKICPKKHLMLQVGTATFAPRHEHVSYNTLNIVALAQ